jgi:hypothetical protein
VELSRGQKDRIVLREHVKLLRACEFQVTAAYVRKLLTYPKLCMATMQVDVPLDSLGDYTGMAFNLFNLSSEWV